MSYLLDTCVISELVRPVPDEGVLRWIDERNEFDLYLSVLTLGELRKGIARLSAGKKKTQLTSWLKDELEVRFADRVIAVTSDIALLWGSLLAEAEIAGQSLSVIDALIAATAGVKDLVLVTRNVRDFNGCSVEIVNPWSTISGSLCREPIP